jgi:hypothetical protein
MESMDDWDESSDDDAAPYQSESAIPGTVDPLQQVADVIRPQPSSIFSEQVHVLSGGPQPESGGENEHPHPPLDPNTTHTHGGPIFTAPVNPQPNPPPPPRPIIALPRGLTTIQQLYFHKQNELRSYRTVVETITYPYKVPKEHPEDEETVEQRQLSGPAALRTCLKRTALGLVWEPGQSGGRDPYLCEEDVAAFEGMVVQHANQMNCLTTHQAMYIAFFLRKARLVKASDLLESIGSVELAVRVREQKIEQPDPSWLAQFANKVGISVLTPQDIEQERRHSCNVKAVNAFFERFSGELSRDRALILNCDETHVSSRKRFKVLTPDGHAALKECREKLPHFSAMCTVSGSCHKFKPMFILPECVTLPEELTEFSEQALFVSTGTGWMTQRAFLMYAHFLLHELKIYRGCLPIYLRDARFLLILDGHSSRWTYEAIYVLHVGGVDVLVLPAHCTHVLQVFDVSIGGVLKVRLAELCDMLSRELDISMTLTLEELQVLVETSRAPESIAQKRLLIFAAFLDAWDEAACQRIIRRGFKKCGIFPLNAEKPLKNSLTRRLEPNEFFATPGLIPSDMNCAMVTEPGRLSILKAKPNKIFGRHDEKLTELVEQWRELVAEPVVPGRFLGGPSGFIWGAQMRSTQMPAESPSLRYGCQVDKIILPAVWQITSRLVRGFPIVITLGIAGKCQPLLRYFEENSIEHVAPFKKGKQEVREQAWYDFHTGKVDVCVTTLNNLLGRTFARRTVTVYAGVPNWLTAQLMPISDTLIFFEKEADLAPFKKAGQQIQIVPRSQYDPMETA